MKLLHVSMWYYPISGGQEYYIYELNQVLKQKFSQINVIQPSKGTRGESPENVVFTQRIPFLVRILPGIDWFWFNGMLRLKRTFLQKHDLIISHYAFHLKAIGKTSTRIMLSHGVEWSEPPKTFIDKYRKKVALTSRKNADCIVANDTNFLRTIGIDIVPGTKEFSEVEPDVWYIPNCIDTKYYTKNEDIEKEDYILVPRNIRYDRGIHYAISIMHHLIKKETNLKLFIAGGPLKGKYFEECTNLVIKYDLEDSVHFLGNQNKEALKKLYLGAKCTLIPTLEKEGTSLSALESMACGTLTFSTSVGGLADLPTIKINLEEEDASKVILDALKNEDALTQKQYTMTTERFNYSNWARCWNQVIDKYSKEAK